MNEEERRKANKQAGVEKAWNKEQKKPRKRIDTMDLNPAKENGLIDDDSQEGITGKFLISMMACRVL